MTSMLCQQVCSRCSRQSDQIIKWKWTKHSQFLKLDRNLTSLNLCRQGLFIAEICDFFPPCKILHYCANRRPFLFWYMNIRQVLPGFAVRLPADLQMLMSSQWACCLLYLVLSLVLPPDCQRLKNLRQLAETVLKCSLFSLCRFQVPSVKSCGWKPD